MMSKNPYKLSREAAYTYANAFNQSTIIDGGMEIYVAHRIKGKFPHEYEVKSYVLVAGAWQFHRKMQ
jgi:hypothetical protein